MAKPTSDTDATIESLLQQRTQYEQWLAATLCAQLLP